jgi:hypothetical protein
MTQGWALAADKSLLEESAAPLKAAIHRSLQSIENFKCMSQMQRIFEELNDDDTLEDLLLTMGANETNSTEDSLNPMNGDLMMEDDFFSEQCKIKNATGSLVCNLGDSIFELAPDCSRAGGRPMALNAQVNCHGSEVLELKHIPFCVGRSCDESLISFLSDAANGSEEMQENNCTVSLTVSQKGGHCFEEAAGNVISFPVGAENAVRVRKCKWLQKKPLKNRKRICQFNNVADACPITCCQCKSERKLVFLSKIRHRDGDVDYRLKNCGWLNRKSEEEKNWYCSKKRPSANGYEPAWKQCPSTCGFCDEY